MTRENRTTHPPPIAVWLVELFTPDNQIEAIPGDLVEEYGQVVQELGQSYGRRWYWRQALKTIAHIICDGLRVAGWSILGSIFGACLLGWFTLALTEKTVNAVLHRYDVYSYVSAPIFWLLYAILIERIVNPMLMGCLVGAVVKGRELVAAITLSMLIGILSAMDLVRIATLPAPTNFPSWYKNPVLHLKMLEPELVATFLSPIMIVVGAAFLRISPYRAKSGVAR